MLMPTVKDKPTSIGSKSNYGPTALAVIVSKVFDYIAYSLTTWINRLDFNTKRNQDMRVYASKKAVLKYRSFE